MSVPKKKSVRPFQPDDRQRQAIEHVSGPMLVVAGAGTGKTTVLIQRIAMLIREGHAKASEILSLTYADNAAAEMRERVEAELRDEDLSGLQTKTFHAYCNELLIRNGRGFGVLDEKDIWIFLRRRIRELGLNYFAHAANVTRFLEDLLSFIRRCQDELVTPEKYTEFIRQVELGNFPLPRVGKSSKKSAELTREESLGRSKEIGQVFAKVEGLLRENNLGSFGDMITHADALLEQDDQLLQAERGRARFILVDEFQDANFAQVKILKKLAGEAQNIFAVGDPDQGIYRFRGASSAAFGLFQRQFPTAKLVVLDKNRRSTMPILNCAFAAISQNPDFVSTVPGSSLQYRRSRLISARDETLAAEGGAPEHRPVEGVIYAVKDGEGFDVADTIEQIHKKTRCAWKDFAVIYRTHTHRDEVTAELAKKRIPFTIENLDVMDSSEVRDLLACLRCVSPGKGDSASWLRVAALSRFSVQAEDLRAAMRTVPREQRAAAAVISLGKVNGGAEVLDLCAGVRDDLARSNAKCAAALEIIIRRFGFDRRSKVVATLIKFALDWEGELITETGEVAEFLEYLDLFRDAGGTIGLTFEEGDAVRLMTAHAAKGLEFDHVFVLRVTSGCFPSHYKETLFDFPAQLRDVDSVTQSDNKTLHAEEERRLFYVALTRARNTLTIYGPKGRGKHDHTPPGYLRELLQDSSIRKWIRERQGRSFQPSIFAQAAAAISRSAEWLNLEPGRNLGAKLSASAIENYETCAMKFKLARDWNLSTDAPAAMQYGATMHRVLLAHYDAIKQGRPLTEDALLDLFRADLGAARLQDAYQFELYEKQGVAQLREFLAQTKRQPPPTVLHTEESFEVKLGGATVVGRIDRMDSDPQERGQVVITDYKTGKPRSQEDADESLQLSIYALAAREKWGYKPNSLVFYNLTDNSAIRTHRSEAELVGAGERVRKVAADIAAGKFDAKTGFHCRYCDFRNLCPATEKRVDFTGKTKTSEN